MFENLPKKTKIKTKKTEFVGYDMLKTQSTILAILNKNGESVDNLNGLGFLILDKTPLFAMGGGQDSDKGNIYLDNKEIELLDVRKDIWTEYYIHAINTNTLNLKINDVLNIQVNSENRQLTSIHHSGLHIVWQSILNFIKEPIKEIGSKVTSEKFVIQWENCETINPELIEQTIKWTNQKIFSQKISSNIFWTSQEIANKNHWLLEFTKLSENEKVRIVEFPNYSIEACSGTHVKNTSEINAVYFLNYDKNAKRTIATFTCNKLFAEKWFAEKNDSKYNEIQNIITKLENESYQQDLENYKLEVIKNNNWSFISTQNLNNLLKIITKIINEFHNKKEKELQEEYKKNLKTEQQTNDNFKIYKTENILYTNKIILKTAIEQANINKNKILIFLNNINTNTNLVIIRNRNLTNFDINKYFANFIKQTQFKGGGNPSMMQLTSDNLNDFQMLINFLNI